MYIERDQIVEEIRLRKLVRQAIHIVESKKSKTVVVSERDRLRSVIRSPFLVLKQLDDKEKDEEDKIDSSIFTGETGEA